MRNNEVKRILGNCRDYKGYTPYKDQPDWRKIGVVSHMGVYRHKSGYTYKVGSPNDGYTYTAEGIKEWLLSYDSDFTGDGLAAIRFISG